MTSELHYKPENLPESWQSVLRQIYGNQVREGQGYNPQQISYVREITEAEGRGLKQWSNAALRGSVVQNLYKVAGELKPLQINKVIREAVLREDILRTNFCPVGDTMLAVVFKERRDMPPVMYRNLEDLSPSELDSTLDRIMAADMRQSFDIRHDNPIRFSVLHTGKNEYAVVVTALQAIFTSLDIKNMFRRFCSLPIDTSTLSHSKISPPRGMADSIKAYWQKILADLPEAVPIPHQNPHPELGEQREKAYLTYLPPEIFSDVKSQAKSNRFMLTAILQTAWCLYLAEADDREDVTVCLLVPPKDKAEQDSAQNLVPVRLKLEHRQTVQNTVNAAFQQMLISHSYAAPGREGIEELLGRLENRFSQTMNFCDFLRDSTNYSAASAVPLGNLVRQNAWDGRDVKLGLHFRSENQRLAVSFAYDGAYFSKEDIELIAKEYILTIQQMLTDWNASLAFFRERLAEHRRLQAAKPVQDTQAMLQDVLSRLPLLHGFEKGQIPKLLRTARLTTRFEGDRIGLAELTDSLVFVVEGRLSRSIETGDGWYNTLDILKENGWVNDTVFLEQPKVKISAEVLTDNATLIALPLPNVRNTLREQPQLGVNVIRHLSVQMEKYRKLWIQS